MMDISEASNLIKNYRMSGGNWYRLASIIREVSRTEVWRSQFKSNAEWLKGAAKLSGYHPAVIRRMIRAIYFLDTMIDKEGLILDANSDIPLASLEILERMYPLNPERASQLVRSALDDEVTLREVQRAYETIVSNHPEQGKNQKSVRMQSSDFQIRASNAIRSSINIFSGGDKHIVFKSQNLSIPLLLRTDLIIAASNNYFDKYCDGYISCFIQSDISLEEQCRELLPLITYCCDFFRRFWVILPGVNGKNASKIMTSTLRQLSLHNIAFAILNDNPETDNQNEKWVLTSSIFSAESRAPDEPGFFPSEGEYSPRWQAIFLNMMECYV